MLSNKGKQMRLQNLIEKGKFTTEGERNRRIKGKKYNPSSLVGEEFGRLGSEETKS